MELFYDLGFFNRSIRKITFFDILFKKMAFGNSLFFRLIKLTKNRVFFILDKKECFLDQKKEIFKNSNQWKFFNGVSLWFWSNKRNFYHVCFWGKKRSFFDILNKINGFLDQKNGVLEKSKKSEFFKGVRPRFF